MESQLVKEFFIKPIDSFFKKDLRFNFIIKDTYLVIHFENHSNYNVYDNIKWHIDENELLAKTLIKIGKKFEESGSGSNHFNYKGEIEHLGPKKEKFIQIFYLNSLQNEHWIKEIKKEGVTVEILNESIITVKVSKKNRKSEKLSKIREKE